MHFVYYPVDVGSQSCVPLWSGSAHHLETEGKFVGLETEGDSVFAAVNKGTWAAFNADDVGVWGEDCAMVLHGGTGPLARPFAHSVNLMACSARIASLACSFVCLLTRKLVGK